MCQMWQNYITFIFVMTYVVLALWLCVLFNLAAIDRSLLSSHSLVCSSRQKAKKRWTFFQKEKSTNCIHGSQTWIRIRIILVGMILFLFPIKWLDVYLLFCFNYWFNQIHFSMWCLMMNWRGDGKSRILATLWKLQLRTACWVSLRHERFLYCWHNVESFQCY